MSGGYLQKKSLKTQNGEIFYWLDSSFKDRPFVVLLHGLSSNHTTWLNAIKVLHDNAFNSLAPDMRGHGLSDKSKIKNLYEPEIFSEDLRQITAAENIQNFFLIGYSFGGEVAVNFTAQHQASVKGLALISTNITPPLEYPRLGIFTLPVVAILNVLAWLLFWQKLANYQYYEHGRAAGYWDSIWDGFKTMPLTVNFWLLAQAFKVDLRSAIKKIRTPAILVYGKNDVYITRQEITDVAKALPQAQLMISQNPGHFIGTNAQDETSQIILNFLKQQCA